MSNNTFYSHDDYCHFLAHYGVKGMKWGVRKQRLKAGFDSAARSAKTAIKNFGHDYGPDAQWRRSLLTQRAGHDAASAEINRALASKTMSGRYSEMYGAGSSRSRHEARAKMYRDQATTYVSDRRRRNAERLARNEQSLADAYDKSARFYEKGGKAAMRRRLRNAGTLINPNLNPDVLRSTYERRNGKKITYGRHLAEQEVNKRIANATANYLKKKAKKRLEEELWRRGYGNK